MKLWEKKGTWIMAGLLVLIMIGASGLGKWSEANLPLEEAGAGQEEMLQENREYMAIQLSDPDLDEGVRENLEAELAITEYRLDNELIPPEETTQAQHLLDSHVMMTMVILFSVIAAGTIVSAEFSQGTIKMLLSRPVKRWKILTSKYVASFIYVLVLTVLAFAATALASVLFFESGDITVLDYRDGTVVEVSYWGRVIALYSLQFVGIMIYTTFAFMLGTVFRSSSLAIGLSIFLMFVGPNIVMLLSDYEVAKYLIFAHTDLTGYLTGQMLLPGISWPFSLAVISAYMAILLVLSYMTFMKRDVMA
jgi:ABC-2 type transport system permease protein